MMNAREVVLHSLIMVQFRKMIFGLAEFRESFLLPESESAWQNTLDKNHGSYSLRER